MYFSYIYIFFFEQKLNVFFNIFFSYNEIIRKDKKHFQA